jgi:hypothetical protein
MMQAIYVQPNLFLATSILLQASIQLYSATTTKWAKCLNHNQGEVQAMYHLRDKVLNQDRSVFKATVDIHLTEPAHQL